MDDLLHLLLDRHIDNLLAMYPTSSENRRKVHHKATKALLNVEVVLALMLHHFRHVHDFLLLRFKPNQIIGTKRHANGLRKRH